MVELEKKQKGEANAETEEDQKKDDGKLKAADVTMDEIAKGDADLENPIAVMWGKKHPEVFKEFEERQYPSESHWGIYSNLNNS